jgi:DNA ligase-1
VRSLTIVIGKVCTGKDTFASKITDAHKIDAGDIVRSIMKQQDRVHDKSLDEQIFQRIIEDLLANQYEKVIVTGIRQETIVSALNRYLTSYDFKIVYLTGSLLTLKERFNKRQADKDTKLSFEEVVKRDGELGLEQLEQILQQQKDFITTIYIPMNITLYKKSRAGKLQQWTIETDNNMFRTTEGYVGGALTTTAWTVCEGKSIGASNETTPQAQAIKEAEAKVKRQGDKGWADSPEGIAAAKPVVAPKLAQKYKDTKKYIDTVDVWALMPKLDGARCLDVLDELYSRTGKSILAVPHLMEELKDLTDGLPTSTIVDGELYNHDLKADFDELISIVRKQKPTDEDFAKSERLMQYHIFDLDMPGTFAARYAALEQLMNNRSYKYLKLVPAVFVKRDENFEATVQAHYEKWLDEGYEGLMYINANSSYHNFRSKDLIKRKEMIDAEFEIVNFEEGKGNRAGMAARVICKDSRGEIFKPGIIGTEAYCRQLLIDKDQYIGKMATIQYQNLTPDRQVPRFCKMKAIRDYE